MKLCRDGLYFRCRNGERCIAKSLTCDNIADCPDASDESDHLCDAESREASNRKPCELDKEFECELKICIPKEDVCDGIEHCSDGRDEDPVMCRKLNVNINKLHILSYLNAISQIFRQRAKDSSVITDNASLGMNGFVMDLKTVLMEVMNFIVPPTANFQVEASCASRKMSVLL